jgi:O-methyltransferase
MHKKLVVFDSFQGLPANRENHSKTIRGDDISGWFREGEFSGTREEVRQNVAAHGDLDSCEFIEGWFEDTMPSFAEPIAGAFLDVDLAESTRTCLKHLFPLIEPGGVLISQDGDFPLVIEVFDDPKFWEYEVGVEPPVVEGLGREKLIVIHR